MKVGNYIGYLVGFFGSIASIASLFLYDKDCIHNIIFHNSFYIICLIICLITIYFLLKKFWKYKKYYNSYPKISEAFNKLHIILNPDIHNNTDLSADLSILQDFCSKLKESFDEITENSTAVCIKLLRYSHNNPDIFTLIRDRSSDELRPTKERDEQDNIVHYLSENTDFLYIFDESLNPGLKNKYYQSNNLCKEIYYRNSRIDYDNFPPPFKWYYISKEWHRCKNWPLAYKSSLVVPILPLTEDRIGDHKLEGFLCLDTPRKNAFDKRDIDILRGVADGMYSTMRHLREKYFTE